MRTKRRFRSWPVIVSAASVVIGLSGVSAAPTKIVTGPDEGSPPQINSYSPTGTSTGSFLGYSASFTGGVRVAMGDVRSTNDIIIGAGPGSAPHVRVFHVLTNNEVYSFFAYPPNFTLGIFVAGGDINGDGRADIIVGTGDGIGSAPHVKVFSGADGSTELHSFFAFNSGFTGGVRVAAGDVNRDGRADIIAGAGPGAAQVNVYSGMNLGLLGSFIAYPGYTGGIYVACGDIDGDGFDDIITGTGTGASHVKVFSGQNGGELQSYFAFPGSTGGVRVAATDLNGNGRADIIAATGPGDTSRLKGVDGLTLATLVDLIPYGSSTAGVFPGAIPRFPAQSLNISTRTSVLSGDNAGVLDESLLGVPPIVVRQRARHPGGWSDAANDLRISNRSLSE